MTNLEKLILERVRVEAKIRSLKVIAINKVFVNIKDYPADIIQRCVALHNSMHIELGKGIPDIRKIDDIIDDLEAKLDM